MQIMLKRFEPKGVLCRFKVDPFETAGHPRAALIN